MLIYIYMLDVPYQMDKIPGSCIYELGQSFPLELAFEVEFKSQS